ncbi:MAG: aminodeoxychorismate lyase [Gammaproteobacteria bacterium]|nr:aminodeoxychorismate lyase [Gammaproteobacteria bacterium]
MSQGSVTTWINGQAGNQVAVTDRGLNYGDGIFTTILVTQGQCQDLVAHLARLQQGLKLLNIATVDYVALAAQLTEIAKAQAMAVIKVLISRGQGTRGYSCVGCDTPLVVVTTSDYPAHYHTLRQQGISLGVSTIALGLNPLLAGIKHLNRLEQVLVRQQIDDSDYQDAVVLDCQGFIVETGIANIFWVKDNVVYSPSLELAGVKGIMRAKVITWLTEAGYQVDTDRYRLSSIMSADEVFITNCLMTVVRVNNIEQTHFDQREIFELIEAKLQHD